MMQACAVKRVSEEACGACDKQLPEMQLNISHRPGLEHTRQR